MSNFTTAVFFPPFGIHSRKHVNLYDSGYERPVHFHKIRSGSLETQVEESTQSESARLTETAGSPRLRTALSECARGGTRKMALATPVQTGDQHHHLDASSTHTRDITTSGTNLIHETQEVAILADMTDLGPTSATNETYLCSPGPIWDSVSQRSPAFETHSVTERRIRAHRLSTIVTDGQLDEVLDSTRQPWPKRRQGSLKRLADQDEVTETPEPERPSALAYRNRRKRSVSPSMPVFKPLKRSSDPIILAPDSRRRQVRSTRLSESHTLAYDKSFQLSSSSCFIQENTASQPFSSPERASERESHFRGPPIELIEQAGLKMAAPKEVPSTSCHHSSSARHSQRSPRARVAKTRHQVNPNPSQVPGDPSRSRRLTHPSTIRSESSGHFDESANLEQADRHHSPEESSSMSSQPGFGDSFTRSFSTWENSFTRSAVATSRVEVSAGGRDVSDWMLVDEERDESQRESLDAYPDCLLFRRLRV